MSFNSNTPTVSYVIQANQVIFDFDFKIFNISDINIQTVDHINSNISDITSGYTVSINGDLGGTVTFSNKLIENDVITLTRKLQIDRTTDYQKNGDLTASELNSDQDYQTYLIDDLNVTNINSVQLHPLTPSNVSNILPIPKPLTILKWNNTGTALVNETLSSAGLGGQFTDQGTTLGKSVPFLVEETGIEDIVVVSGTNAFGVDSITIPNRASLTVQDNAVYKIL